MNYRFTLLLLTFSFLSFNLLGQTLEFIGEIPEKLKKSSVTLIVEHPGKRPYKAQRIIPATFLAFKSSGYRVFVKSEQKLALETSLANEPTQLAALISGKFKNNSVKKLTIKIINQKTGELVQTISLPASSGSLAYDKFTSELLVILDLNAEREYPKKRVFVKGN